MKNIDEGSSLHFFFPSTVHAVLLSGMCY